jgi:hypothetical protein
MKLSALLLPLLCVCSGLQAYTWGPVSNTSSEKHHYAVGIDVIRLNDWNNQTSGYGSESMWANNAGNWGATATHANGVGHVKSYLSAWRGVRHGYDSSEWSWWGGQPHNLGKPLSEISTLKVRWKFTSPNTGRHISLVDVFFDDVAAQTGKNKINLMFMPLLQDRTGWLNGPDARGPSIGSVTASGVTYNVFYSGAKDWADHVYAIIPATQTRDLTIDVRAVAIWIRDNHSGTALTNSKRLTSIWSGWEPIEVLASNNAFTTTAYNIDYKLNTSMTYYADALTSGWTDWSWDATNTLGSTTRYKVGSKAIQVNFTSQYGGLSLRADKLQPTAGYGAIEFWAHPDGSSAKSVYVWTSNADSGGNSTSVTKSIPANVWTKIRVPLSDLGNPTAIKRVNISNNTGVASTRIYIDDLKIVP